MNNNIFYIDMDSFYASVEQLENPIKAPLIVCKNSEKSIILSANYFAREKGINSGMPLFLAKQKYPNVIVCKPNLEKYNLYSSKIENALNFFSSNVVKQSVDEWFIDFSKSKLIYSDEYELASRIQNKIKKDIGLSSSIGISYNVFFAKMASSINKPFGINIISKENFKSLIWDKKINEMHMIGKKTSMEMKKIGINKIYDLANFEDKNLLKEKFGIMGIKMYEYSNGIFNDFISSKTTSISVSKTFDHLLNDEREIWENFKIIFQELWNKTVYENIFFKKIIITLYDRNKSESKSFSFYSYNLSYKKYFTQSIALFDKISLKKNINKISINFSNLINSFEIQDQLNLFSNEIDKDIVNQVNSKLKNKLVIYADKKLI
ncbi:MAG: Y-family DNA polymerase [Mycoplasmoidaceae bacterium]